MLFVRNVKLEDFNEKSIEEDFVSYHITTNRYILQIIKQIVRILGLQYNMTSKTNFFT